VDTNALDKKIYQSELLQNQMECYSLQVGLKNKKSFYKGVGRFRETNDTKEQTSLD
jgi:hypothetical protein